MNYFSIDAFIVYGFLLITLGVGLWAGRNVKTLQEYAIANRVYGTGILTMTMLATFITGSQAVGYVGYVFDDGILPIISIFFCGVIICFFLIARFVSPHITYFDGCLTMAEIMGRLYGQKIRVCIGILGIFYCLVIVTLQIIWLGYIGELIDIPGQWSVVLGGSFLVIYAARGGMKSIAITDILQFIAITLLVPLAANLLLHKVGGITNIFTHVPSNNFNFIYHPSFKDYLVYCLWGLFPAFPLSFPFIQRMLMAKDKRQITKSQYLGIGYLTVFYVLLTLIGLAAIALKNMGDVNMPQQGSKVFVYLAKTYFPAGIRGIIGIGLLAAVMSTADSFLHAAGILVANDIVGPLWKNKNFTTHSLRLSQYATFFLGLAALGISLTYKILPRVQYGGVDLGHGINIIMDFVAIVFTVPLIAGIMGLKTDARSFYISSVTTILSFFFAKFFLPNLFFIPFAILMNALSFFGTHYIQNKGFVTVKRTVKVLD